MDSGRISRLGRGLSKSSLRRRGGAPWQHKRIVESIAAYGRLRTMTFFALAIRPLALASIWTMYNPGGTGSPVSDSLSQLTLDAGPGLLPVEQCRQEIPLDVEHPHANQGGSVGQFEMDADDVGERIGPRLDDDSRGKWLVNTVRSSRRASDDERVRPTHHRDLCRQSAPTSAPVSPPARTARGRGYHPPDCRE